MREPPPAPESPDYDAWVQKTAEELLTAEDTEPPITLKAKVMQFEGVIKRLRHGRDKKSWPTIARLLEAKGIHVDADVLRVTYGRVRDDKRSKFPKRIVSPQAPPPPTPKVVTRSDPTGDQMPVAPSGTRPNLSGRVR